MVCWLRGMCLLQQWEVEVVSKLDWCLASVVPSDFLEPVLQALPFVPPNHHQSVRRHVHSFIAVAAIGKLHNYGRPHTVQQNKVRTGYKIFCFHLVLSYYGDQLRPFYCSKSNCFIHSIAVKVEYFWWFNS